VRRLTGYPFHASLLDPSGGHLDPLAYVRGLAAAAIGAGAHLFTDTAVTGVEDGAGGLGLARAAGTVTAPQVLLCVIGRARGLAPEVHRSLLPVHVFEMATAPLAAATRVRLGPEGHMVSDTRNAVFAYHLRPEGRLLSGAITFPQGDPTPAGRARRAPSPERPAGPAARTSPLALPRRRWRRSRRDRYPRKGSRAGCGDR
jgi:glycine/D-amino acid oxidase-like deaminating enzyme